MNEKKLIESAKELEEIRTTTNSELENVYYQLSNIKHFDYKITDHSIVRYLQRVELIPVSEARYKILSSIQNFMDTVKPKLNLLKNNTFELRLNGIIYVIKNKTIITIKTVE